MEEIKKYKIIGSPSFKYELDEILYYISAKLKEPNIAKNIYHTILDKIKTLEYFPESHYIIKTRNIEYRKLLIQNYIIIYSIDFKSQKVYILHIFHSSQNYLSLI